jgi:Domain of Unknown Function (DUF1080)
MKPLALTAALFVAISTQVRAQDADGFVPLFNGKDLTGWRPVNVAADTFAVRGGMIVTTGVPTGFMATERQYENFIIELDWRHMKEGGNSGLFIWGEGLPAPGVPYAKGIEVQVLDLGYEKNKGAWEWFTSHGDIFPIWGATMTAVAPTAKSGVRSFPSEKRVKPSPEWNHYRVECNNGEIRLSVNGKEVTVGKDCVPRKGYICLESEGSECHFKNIRIKELPSTGATPEQTAESYAGFTQMFDGKTFAGWKINDANKDVWSSRGLHVIAKAGVKGSGLDLWTEKNYKDFSLVADWKFRTKPVKKMVNEIAPNGEEPILRPDGKPKQIEVEEPADSGIYLRGSSKAQVNIWVRPIGSGDIRGYRVDKSLPMDIRTACTPKVNADAKPGQWNRFFITMKGDRCTVILNGKTIIDNAQLPGIAEEGPIALQYHHDEIEFANVFIKELE